MVFYKAFSADDARVLSMAMSRADEKSFYDLEYIATMARRMEETVVKRLGGNTAVVSSGSGPGSGSRKRNAGSGSIPVSTEAKKSKWYEPSSVSGPGNAGASAGPWRSRFGKTMQQHPEDGTCKTCNKHFGPEHSCYSVGGSSGSSIEDNKISDSHKFEVFSFYSEENVHVLLGMDTLSKIGIGISGLVSQRGFQTGPSSMFPYEHIYILTRTSVGP